MYIKFIFFPLFSETVELVCDPPCTGNKVCRNYSGVPECICADGFTGEGVCTGILDNFSFHQYYFKATSEKVRNLKKRNDKDVRSPPISFRSTIVAVYRDWLHLKA